MRFPHVIGCIGLGVLGLSGCASFVPKPLPSHITLPQTASSISVDQERLPFGQLAAHRFDPSDGLDMDEIAMLAVANNPQLRQARDSLGIARAQSFAAGLLPDPQLGLSFDHPTNGTTGNTNAFVINPSFDVNALLLRSSRVGASLFEEKRINLDLLWQEWQVVSQSHLLFARLQAQQQLLGQLESSQRLLAAAYARSQQALADGNTTLDAVSADLMAMQTVEKQRNDLQRARLQDQAALFKLLGLAPGVDLKLVGDPVVPRFDAAKVRASLDERLASRPDMLALKAGYQSQEEKFRGAVLAQFPALNVGLTRARDTSGLYTLGFGLTLSLPLFNANRGNIAIERATRTLLYDQYQDRLNESAAEIETALDNLPLLTDQLARTGAGVRELESVVDRAGQALRVGNMTAPDYIRLRTALLDKQIEAINLKEALAEQAIVLETLLGPELPATKVRSKK